MTLLAHWTPEMEPDTFVVLFIGIALGFLFARKKYLALSK